MIIQFNESTKDGVELPVLVQIIKGYYDAELIANIKQYIRSSMDYNFSLINNNGMHSKYQMINDLSGMQHKCYFDFGAEYDASFNVIKTWNISCIILN